MSTKSSSTREEKEEALRAQLTAVFKTEKLSIPEKDVEFAVNMVVGAVLGGFSAAKQRGVTVELIEDDIEYITRVMGGESENINHPLKAERFKFILTKALGERVNTTPVVDDLQEKIKDRLRGELIKLHEGGKHPELGCLFNKEKELFPDSFESFYDVIDSGNSEAYQNVLKNTRKIPINNAKTSIGAVGVWKAVALAVAGVVAYVAGRSVTPSAEEEAQKPEGEKKSKFLPNALKFAGVVALLGGLVWSAKILLSRNPTQRELG